MPHLIKTGFCILFPMGKMHNLIIYTLYIEELTL